MATATTRSGMTSTGGRRRLASINPAGGALTAGQDAQGGSVVVADVVVDPLGVDVLGGVLVVVAGAAVVSVVGVPGAVVVAAATVVAVWHGEVVGIVVA